MVDIATGINGASAQFLAVEDSGLAAGHAIARNHSMAEKVAQLSDPQFRQRNAVPVNVPVSVYLILCQCRINSFKSDRVSRSDCSHLILSLEMHVKKVPVY